MKYIKLGWNRDIFDKLMKIGIGDWRLGDEDRHKPQSPSSNNII
jgi:hypothetical protein